MKELKIMSNLFRVYFVLGTYIDILSAEYDYIMDQLTKGMTGNFIELAPVNSTTQQAGRKLVLNINQISHILEIQVENKGAVVRPNNPQLIRNDAERIEADKSKDLDSALEDIKKEFR